MAHESNNPKMRGGIVALTGWLALALYIVSCCLPVIRIDNGVPSGEFDFKMGSPSGLAVLMLAWFGPNLEVIPWSANFFFLTGLVALICRSQAAIRFGWIAVLLGATSWFFAWPFKDQVLLGGYYAWQGSLVVLAVGAKLALVREQRNAPAVIPPQEAAA